MPVLSAALSWDNRHSQLLLALRQSGSKAVLRGALKGADTAVVPQQGGGHALGGTCQLKVLVRELDAVEEHCLQVGRGPWRERWRARVWVCVGGGGGGWGVGGEGGGCWGGGGGWLVPIVFATAVVEEHCLQVGRGGRERGSPRLQRLAWRWCMSYEARVSALC